MSAATVPPAAPKENAKRRRIFVDRRVQGSLILRLLGYGVAFVVCFIALDALWSLLTNPLRPMEEVYANAKARAAPVAIAAFVLLPVILYDLVRLSNRFVGPVLRLRGALRELARGKSTPTIQFRGGDFWTELATDFNVVSAQVAANKDGDDKEFSDKDADKEVATCA